MKNQEREDREVYVRPELKGPDEVHVVGVTGKTVTLKLSRLEFLQSRHVITPRQYTAGIWLAERWSAYFTPGVSSGIEDHAPGAVPSDPFARWTKGQTGYRVTKKGVVVRKPPPPTFRPRKPSDRPRANDGFSHGRLDDLQRWIRARRLIDHLTPFERNVLIGVAVEGYPLFEAAKRALGSAQRAGRAERLLRRAQEALWKGLDAIADEIEPAVSEMAMNVSEAV